MITVSQCNKWRRGNLVKLSRLKIQDHVLDYYRGLVTSGSPDMVALRAVEHSMLAVGFTAIQLQCGRLVTTYGTMPARVYVAHYADHIEYIVCSAAFNGFEKISRVVAHYQVTRDAVVQVAFDVAGLILQ